MQHVVHFSSLPLLIHTPYSSPAALSGPFSSHRSGRKQLPTSSSLILLLNCLFAFVEEIFAVCCSLRVAVMKFFRGESLESAPVARGQPADGDNAAGRGWDGRKTRRSGSSGQKKCLCHCFSRQTFHYQMCSCPTFVETDSFSSYFSFLQ